MTSPSECGGDDACEAGRPVFLGVGDELAVLLRGLAFGIPDAEPVRSCGERQAGGADDSPSRVAVDATGAGQVIERRRDLPVVRARETGQGRTARPVSWCSRRTNISLR